MGGLFSKANRVVNPTAADKLEMINNARKNHIMYNIRTTNNMRPIFLILLLIIVYLCTIKNK